MSEVVATPTQRKARIALIAGGVALLGVGGLTLLMDVEPKAYIGIVLWFAGAIIIHDGIIAPVVFGVGVLMRRAGRRLPGAVLAILQAGVVVLSIVTALIVPAILKKDIGSANPTILPLDYVANLGVVYAVVAVLTVAAVIVYLLVAARRQKSRPSSVQD